MTILTERIELPAEPSSAGAARRFVSGLLSDPTETVETVVLLVSELASNAVLHARTPFELRVRVDDTTIRVEVIDANPMLPALKAYAPESVTGRGLHMVADEADRWGCETVAEGKVVWFEVARSPVRSRP
jgi:anti-sigma regulatory factor (Ser/Thr protein kinase)